MIADKKLLEYARVHGNYYGTPKDFVLNSINQGDVVILEIDVQGALQVKKNYPDAVLVFVLPPDFEELKRRLVERGCWGDSWTNQIQPFWALTILAIAGLDVRDIMGYCLSIALWVGIFVSLAFLIL